MNLREGAHRRPVHIAQVPLDVSAPLGSRRRALVNGVLARALPPGSLNIVMHWAIRVDNTFFELKRYPGQSKPGFERNLWEWHKIRSITTQELYGYTSMNDAEIEAVGKSRVLPAENIAVLTEPQRSGIHRCCKPAL